MVDAALPVISALDKLPDNQLFGALKQRGKHETMMHMLVGETETSNLPQVVHLLDKLTHTECVDALKQLNSAKNKETPLHYAVDWNPTALAPILDKLSITDLQTLLQASDKPFKASPESCELCKTWLFEQLAKLDPQLEEKTAELKQAITEASTGEQLLNQPLLQQIKVLETQTYKNRLHPDQADQAGQADQASQADQAGQADTPESSSKP